MTVHAWNRLHMEMEIIHSQLWVWALAREIGGEERGFSEESFTP